MNLKEGLEYIQENLLEVYPLEETLSMANIVLESVIADYKIKRITEPHTLISEKKKKTIEDYITQLLEGKPLQYVIGHTEFYNSRILLNNDVLIPRPETEELVHWILESEKDIESILDVGTGSGCIPIAIKLERPEIECSAIDISKKALELSAKNAKLNKVEIDFLYDDILKPKKNYKKYSLIVSNPPYVRESEKESMHANVLDYEPTSALFVPNENPLVFYRAVLNFSKAHLFPNGKVYFEINEFLSQEMFELFEQHKFSNVELKNDINGKARMMKAIYSQ